MFEGEAWLPWLLLFAALATLATIAIKILLEFPGLLKLDCVYREDGGEWEGGGVAGREVRPVRAGQGAKQHNRVHFEQKCDASTPRRKMKTVEVEEEEQSGEKDLERIISIGILNCIACF